MTKLVEEVTLTTWELRCALERLREPKTLDGTSRILLHKLEALGIPKEVHPDLYRVFLNKSEQEILEYILTAIGHKYGVCNVPVTTKSGQKVLVIGSSEDAKLVKKLARRIG